KLFHVEQIHSWLFARKVRRRLKIGPLEKAASKWRKDHTKEIFTLPVECPLSKTIVEAFQYVDTTFLDRPAGLAKEGNATGLFYLTSWFDTMQSEYHQPDDWVEKMPLPLLFGRLKAITARRNPSEPDFNAKQDALLAQIQRKMQDKLVTENDLVSGRFKFEDN